MHAYKELSLCVAKSSYFRQHGVQVQRSSDDGSINGYHIVPNHVHSESNRFSGIEDSMYTSNDIRYHSALDNKENTFLNLESDSEDTDELELALCSISDFPNSPTEVTDEDHQYFDLSLDSDTELEFEEALELEWDDDCDEGDDLFCSIQGEQCDENVTEPSDDHLVYLSLNNLTDFDENNDIYMNLPSHDDLSSATVEVLAVSSEATSAEYDVKDVATTTSDIVTVDQLCSDTVTTICFTSAQKFTNEDVHSPLNVTISTGLIGEQKQQCIYGSPESHLTSDFDDNMDNKPEVAHNFPVENNVS